MICLQHIFDYLCYGFTAMITFDITERIYKNLVNPVLGKRKQHQTGFFSYDVIAFESKIKGYVENVFFPLSRAATLKKEIFNKSIPIEILITRQGNKQAAQRHKIRSAVLYLRGQFPFYKDRFNESLSLES